MGFFRFRRSIKILPGVRWNLNKRGSSFTFGGRGYHYTVGNKGSRTTVGIPGTGISYTQIHNTGSKSRTSAPAAPMSTAQKPAMNKAGCLYAAGAVIFVTWLVGHLSSPTPTTTTSSSTVAVSPSPTASVSSTVAATPPRATAVYSPPATAEPLRAVRVFSPAEEARIKHYVPPRVKLRQDTEFNSGNRNSTVPTMYAGQGREVSVVRVVGPDLVVDYAGRQATVPIAKTDFLERVIAEANK